MARLYARIIGVILETERLVLRPFRPADIDAYAPGHLARPPRLQRAIVDGTPRIETRLYVGGARFVGPNGRCLAPQHVDAARFGAARRLDPPDPATRERNSAQLVLY